MAWKLGGDGRLRPDPYTWNNIGRYHHTPGPTGITTNSAGNTVNTYQDPITGGEYYWDSQEWEVDQSVRIVYEIEASSETEYSYVEHIQKDFGVIGTMIFLNPFSNVLGPESSEDMSYWEMIRTMDFPKPIMGMPPPIAPGGGQIKAFRTILKSWNKVNWRSVSLAAKHHYSKHVLNQGMRNNLMQYTDDALNFFNTNKNLGKEIMLRDGSMGMKIRLGPNQPGGIFTTDGRIVSFWYY